MEFHEAVVRLAQKDPEAFAALLVGFRRDRVELMEGESLGQIASRYARYTGQIEGLIMVAEELSRHVGQAVA